VGCRLLTGLPFAPFSLSLSLSLSTLSLSHTHTQLSFNTRVSCGTAMQKLRIVTLALGFGTGRQRMALNEGQISNFRGVRVHVSKGYNRVERNRRASRETAA
jgi:hypothetical protein